MKKTMNRNEEPGIMRPEEYAAVMDLQEKAQGSPKQYLLKHYPHTSARENFIFKDRFVIREGKKIASHAGLFPMRAIAGASEVKIGGIGDVATHPDCRGKGYMGKLLNYSVEQMKARKIPLSILWGITQRYRHYGWETAGRKMCFQLNQRSVKEIKSGREFNLKGYERRDLNKVLEIHEKEALRIKRSRKDYEKILEKASVQVWIGEEKGICSYAVLIGSEVMEFGGNSSSVAKLFSLLLNRYTLANLNVYLPYRDSQILRMLYKISLAWKVAALGMIKIIDLKEVLLSFKEQIKNKIAFHGIGAKNSITLEMTDSRQKITLVTGSEPEINEGKCPDIISLSDIEMTRLLFGISPEDFGENKGQKRLLALLFPLDFYVWGLDHV